jgi:type I restriction enzyme, S subunit
VIEALKPYPASKDCGVPWLGAVPASWEVVPAVAAFRPKLVRNLGLTEKTVLSLSYGKIIVKPAEKLHGLVPESFETYQIVEPGNIIIRSTDLQNDQTSLRVAIARDRGIITSAYMCLEVKGSMTADFGYLLLNSYDLLKVFYGYGSGLRQNLDFSDLKRMPVLIPTPAEQSAIVRFLNHADQRIAGYIRAKRRLIQLLDEQKQALIREAVTRGLNPSVPAKPSGLPWLGDIPAHWELRRAKQLCLAIIDCKNRTPEMVPDGGYAVVRTTCIRNGDFDISGSYPTDRRNYEIWTQRGAPRPGDVFFTREAPTGEACLVPSLSNLCMGQRMMYFRPDPEVLDSRFLLYSIYGPVVRTYIDHMGAGSTVSHLRLGQVYAMPLLWCPLPEQQEIVARVEEATNAISAAQIRAQREVELIREYRTRLIVDVVTGRLDVREAAAKLPDELEEPVPIHEAEILEGEEVGDEAAEMVEVEAGA